jgi:hypothetical protein
MPDLETAFLLLLASTSDDERDRLYDALDRAVADARRSLQESLDGVHVPAVVERHAELVGHPGHPTPLAPALAPGTWLLVLSHLDADSQRVLQRTYEELQRGAEVTVEHGEPADGSVGSVTAALAAVEDLLVELPYTTLERSIGPDDHDSRRATLKIELEWATPGVEEDLAGPVCVVWRDGYETEVASMRMGVFDQNVNWRLEVGDPVPGRSAERVLPREADDLRLIARDGLADAIGWANAELGNRYTFVTLPDSALKPPGD